MVVSIVIQTQALPSSSASQVSPSGKVSIRTWHFQHWVIIRDLLPPYMEVPFTGFISVCSSDPFSNSLQSSVALATSCANETHMNYVCIT